MRGYARGSDGLAEVPEIDVRKILVPELTKAERTELKPYVDGLLAGAPDLHSRLTLMVATEKSSVPYAAKRTSHVILV
jgi:type I restriction enzyme M protein